MSFSFSKYVNLINIFTIIKLYLSFLFLNVYCIIFRKNSNMSAYKRLQYIEFK